MNRFWLSSIACFAAASATAWSASMAAAQEQVRPTARAAEGAILGRPLSSRTLPAAPEVHRLSIGPLSTPMEDAIVGSDRSEGNPAEDADGEALASRAQRGDADANYHLALKFLAGDGVARDLVEAFARVRLAAEAGHARAISLFYTLGAKLTAAEHADSFERARKLRATAISRAPKLTTGTAQK